MSELPEFNAPREPAFENRYAFEHNIARVAESLEKLCAKFCRPGPDIELDFGSFCERLSVRSRKALERMKINSFEDLAQTKASEMLCCRNFSWAGLYEIGYKASRVGIRLWEHDREFV